MERRDIGNRAQRDQVEQAAKVGLCAILEITALAQFAHQRDRNQKRDAHRR